MRSDKQRRIEEELRLRVRNAKGKEILETRITTDIEKCLSRKPRGGLWIVWKRDALGYRFVHIHCKICDNEWKIEEGDDSSIKFELREIQPTLWHIRCKTCGIEFTSG